MNKADLVNVVSASAEVSKKDAEAVITATLDAITDALDILPYTHRKSTLL